MDRIGRYEVVERIGSGGFATVYRVRDPVLDSDVAAKVLAENWADRGELHSRFIREAQLLRRIDSDRVVTVHDIGELPSGQPYFVMALVNRGTLDSRLVQMPQPSTEEILAIATQVAECVRTVHDHGLIHRDIKPSNLLIAGPRTTSGFTPIRVLAQDERLILGDFGLAKDVDLRTRAGLTIAAGTGGYAAPEQMTPDGAPNQQTDYYAATAVMYRVLTASTPPEFDLARQNVPFPAGDPVMTGELGRFFRRGMAFNAVERHRSIGEWLQDFVGAVTAISGSTPISGAETIVGRTEDWVAPSLGSLREPSGPSGPGGPSSGPGGPSSGPGGRPPIPPPPDSNQVPVPPGSAQPDQSQPWAYRPEPFRPSNAPSGPNPSSGGSLLGGPPGPAPGQYVPNPYAPNSGSVTPNPYAPAPGPFTPNPYAPDPRAGGPVDGGSYPLDRVSHRPVTYEAVTQRRAGAGRLVAALAVVVILAVAAGVAYTVLSSQPGPTIAGPSTVAAGRSVTFDAEFAGADDYRWTDWNDDERSGRQFTVTGILPGSLTFDVVALADGDEISGVSTHTIEITEAADGPTIEGPDEVAVRSEGLYTVQLPAGASDPRWVTESGLQPGNQYRVEATGAGPFELAVIVTLADGTDVGTRRTIQLVEGRPS
ncbi:MAG: protein kinase [Acidimicrobiales bacterium]